MVEPALYAALGACLATLFGLMFLPLFWRRAVRLTTRRLAGRLPVSMSEIVAAQDRLRAEHATRIRSVERKAESAAAEIADERIVAGRARSQELGLKNEVAALRLSIELLQTQEAIVRGDLDRTGAEFVATTKALETSRMEAAAAASERDAARETARSLRADGERLRAALAASQASTAASRTELTHAIAELKRTRDAAAASERREAEAVRQLKEESGRLAVAQAARLSAERRLVDETAAVVALRAGVGRNATAVNPGLSEASAAALRARLDEVADAIVRSAEDRKAPLRETVSSQSSPAQAPERERLDVLVGSKAG